jgi:Fe2+ or Zn2+ uptake regulation protein
MKIKDIAYCLNSELRLKILQLLSEKDMTAPDIFLKLKKSVRFRQYINRELEILKNNELISKYYDDDNKKLFFHLCYENVIIAFKTLEIDPK